MKRALIITAALLAGACGDANGIDGESGSIADIHLATQLELATKKVGVRVFAPRDKNDVIVTCTSLLTGNIADDRYDVLQSADFDYPPSDGQAFTISNIKAKDGAVVYVNARDASDTVIGEGCEAGVTVKGGATSQVQITVYPAS